MKRVANLIPQIADMDNLRLAFYKAQKAKADRIEVIQYRKNLEQALAKLSASILTASPAVGNYRYFKIYDPKERNICAAAFSERVLHHALMNICHPIFDKFQIHDSYASRKGKGTYAALERAQYFAKKYPWFLKLDIRGFFDHIDHTVLKNQLLTRFKDPRLLKIFNQIIDSYDLSNGKGLPIGNLTSQYFANHYLGVADHYVKEKLRIPAYIRYMDDMLLFHQDKAVLKTIGKSFIQMVEQQLLLEFKPICLNHVARGLPFLSYLVFPNRLKLARRSKKRFRKKIKSYYAKLEKGYWDEKTFQRHAQPLLAFVQKADSWAIRKEILAPYQEKGL